jgi:ABC-type branched-subunit amino acid transport system substrate-binding protein
MERYRREEAVRVIPIILSQIYWEWMLPEVNLQALPKDAKPITTWSNQNNAYFDAAEGIRRIVEKPLPGTPGGTHPDRWSAFRRFFFLSMQYFDKKNAVKQLCLLLLLILITSPLQPAPYLPPPPKPNGIGVKPININETINGKIVNSPITIGITDGRYNFSNSSGEKCVDDENQLIGSKPYISAIVVTTLSKTAVDNGLSLDIGNEELQGICLWQQKFQASKPALRIFIANIGTKETSVLGDALRIVTPQIINFASQNSNFIGVVGFSFSQAVDDAMKELNQNDIPVISPAASSSDFSGKWPYFSRVVTDSNREGKYLAEYAKETLNASYAYVFSDTGNSYTKTLGEGFINGFENTNNTNYIREQYTVNELDSGNVTDALSNYSTHPGAIIFCACYANDFSTLLTMRKDALQNAFFLGGEAAYELGGYNDGKYKYIDFAAYSYPDAPRTFCNNKQCSSEVTSFSADYCKQFDLADYKLDPQTPTHYGLKYCIGYGKSRPGPHVMQTYDAITALQQAYTNAPKKGGKVSRQDIQQALTQLSFQGISGWIDFRAKPSSDPKNKTVLILCVDGDGKAHLAASYGQFLQQDAPTPQIYTRKETDPNKPYWQCQLPS